MLEGRAIGGDPYTGDAAVTKVERPLDRIGIGAERIERAADLVESFLDRFSPQPKDTAQIAASQGVGYSGQLYRLFDGLDRLEAQVHRLNDIG